MTRVPQSQFCAPSVFLLTPYIYWDHLIVILSNQICVTRFSLQWRHNERDGVSYHQPQDCLLDRLFSRRSKKTLKLRVTGFCVGNSPVTDEFPAQMASNAENGSIRWRHHVLWGFECARLKTTEKRLVKINKYNKYNAHNEQLFNAFEKKRHTRSDSIKFYHRCWHDKLPTPYFYSFQFATHE